MKARSGFSGRSLAKMAKALATARRALKSRKK